jgi:hypothetical protein
VTDYTYYKNPKNTKIRNQSPKNKTKNKTKNRKKKKTVPKAKAPPSSSPRHHQISKHSDADSKNSQTNSEHSGKSGFEAFVIGFFGRSDQILHPQYKAKEVFQRDRLLQPRTRRRKETTRPSPLFFDS